jgi:putative ABC transport system substrate-binding protein
MKAFYKFSLLTITAVLIILSGCSKESKNLTIGISKIVSHPALDAVEQGIQDALKDAGFTAVVYDLQNANGDINTANTIANKFLSSKVDIAVGIATPTAQALVNTIKNIPVLYSAVTDPVSAGLVESYDKGGRNVTGVSDMTPVKEQIMLMNSVKPLKKLGHIYSSSEANAVNLAEIAKKSCEELGIEFIATTVTNSAEVKQAAQAIADKVDAIYISTDNTVVAAISSIAAVAASKKLPIISADPSSAENSDVLIAWGFDYYKIGKATGEIAAAILKGEKTENIPTRFMTDAADVDLLINLDVAKKLGLTIPADVLAKAGKIVENGTLTTK